MVGGVTGVALLSSAVAVSVFTLSTRSEQSVAVPSPTVTVTQVRTVTVKVPAPAVTKTVEDMTCIDALYRDIDSWYVNNQRVVPNGWWDQVCPSP